MTGKTPSCRWILNSWKTEQGDYITRWCNRPVKYSMVEDGGEPGAPKIRKYSPFCPEHLERWEKGE